MLGQDEALLGQTGRWATHGVRGTSGSPCASPADPARRVPRGMNILPLLLCISGANFRLFLRFKDPVSKWTGISPRGRLQPPPCPKTRSDALRHTLPCSNTPYRQHALAARHRTSPHVTAHHRAHPPWRRTPAKRPSPRTFQTTNRSALSTLIPPRPFPQLIHGRAKPLPRFPCCQ